MHYRLRQQCVDHPTSPAVCAWDRDFTYEQLDQLSSQLAHHVQSLGVGPEAFVLLDPSHPIDRLEKTCKSVTAGVIISSGLKLPVCMCLSPVTLSISDDEVRWKEKMPTTCPTSTFQPRHAAYCCFSSGPTGVQKGVVIEHASFCMFAVVSGNLVGLTIRHSTVPVRDKRS